MARDVPRQRGRVSAGAVEAPVVSDHAPVFPAAVAARPEAESGPGVRIGGSPRQSQFLGLEPPASCR